VKAAATVVAPAAMVLAVLVDAQASVAALPLVANRRSATVPRGPVVLAVPVVQVVQVVQAAVLAARARVAPEVPEVVV